MLKYIIIAKDKKNINDLRQWKYILKCRIKNKFKILQCSHSLNQLRYGMNENLLKKQVENILKHFVITSVDKADNIFAIICKNF